jgi:hypothetical protein
MFLESATGRQETAQSSRQILGSSR